MFVFMDNSDSKNVSRQYLIYHLSYLITLKETAKYLSNTLTPLQLYSVLWEDFLAQQGFLVLWLLNRFSQWAAPLEVKRVESYSGWLLSSWLLSCALAVVPFL